MSEGLFSKCFELLRDVTGSNCLINWDKIFYGWFRYNVPYRSSMTVTCVLACCSIPVSIGQNAETSPVGVDFIAWASSNDREPDHLPRVLFFLWSTGTKVLWYVSNRRLADFWLLVFKLNEKSLEMVNRFGAQCNSMITYCSLTFPFFRSLCGIRSQ